MTALHPYSIYKDSAVEWLGKVPEHWKVRRIKTIASIHSGATPSSNSSEYWDGDIVWLTPKDMGAMSESRICRSARSITKAGLDSCGATLAPPGSVIVSTRAPIGHVGILREYACTNQGCRLLVPHEKVESTYLFYSLRVARVTLESLGRGTTFPELSRDTLAAFPICLPPTSEQAAITHFLGDANQRIDHCVSAKKKLIKLLEEYRLTLISNVVMGRIDIRTEKNHEKKGDLGSCHQIPRHWQRKRLKYLSSRSIRNGLGKAGKFANPEHPRYIRTTDIAGPRQLRPDTFRSLPPEMAREAQVYENDILISSAGSVGKSFYAKKLDGKACFAGYLVRISPVPEIDPSFLAYWTESDDYWAQINANVIQTTIQNFSATKVRNLSVPIPPLDTQRHIVRFLDDADWRISTRQKLLKREITLLREYQTRLISDVVTGKLDVREAAASLPDVDSCTAEAIRTEVPESVTKA